MDQDVSVDEKTFDILTFFSGYGFWLLLAVALIVVVLFKKFRK